MFVITNGCMKFLRQDLDFLSYIYKPILACLNRNNLHTFLNLRDKKKTKEDNASFYEDFMAFFFFSFFFMKKEERLLSSLTLKMLSSKMNSFFFNV